MFSKQDLIKVLSETSIPFNEAMSSNTNTNVFPRIVFWETVWEEVTSSSESYETVVTYQVSMHYLTPRPKELLKLRKVLHENGVNPTIYHEYLEDVHEFHSFFSIDVLETLENQDE